MTKESYKLQESKKRITSQIKFFELLLQHLQGTDPIYKSRAVWSSMCVHRYINNCLMSDIQIAMQQKSKKNEAANDYKIENEIFWI